MIELFPRFRGRGVERSPCELEVDLYTKEEGVLGSGSLCQKVTLWWVYVAFSARTYVMLSLAVPVFESLPHICYCCSFPWSKQSA